MISENITFFCHLLKKQSHIVKCVCSESVLIIVFFFFLKWFALSVWKLGDWLHPSRTLNACIEIPCLQDLCIYTCVCVSVAFCVRKFSTVKEHFNHPSKTYVNINAISASVEMCEEQWHKSHWHSSVQVTLYVQSTEPSHFPGEANASAPKVAAPCFGHWRQLPGNPKSAEMVKYICYLVQQLVYLASLGPSASRLIQAIACTWPVSSTLFVYDNVVSLRLSALPKCQFVLL